MGQGRIEEVVKRCWGGWGGEGQYQSEKGCRFSETSNFILPKSKVRDPIAGAV